MKGNMIGHGFLSALLAAANSAPILRFRPTEFRKKAVKNFSPSKYMPHQGKRERERRMRQAA